MVAKIKITNNEDMLVAINSLHRKGEITDAQLAECYCRYRNLKTQEQEEKLKCVIG